MYDLTINTDQLSIHYATDVIVAAVKELGT